MADQNYFGKFGAAAEDQEIGWEGTIEDDGGEYILLEPGTYPFVVQKIERKRYTPKSADSKIPPCNMAVVHLIVQDPKGGEARCQSNLYLTKNREWLLSSFFRCIGQKKRGEPLRMDWNKVPGAMGWVEIGNHEHNGNTYNDVKRFIDPDKAPAGTQPAAQGRTYTAGSF